MPRAGDSAALEDLPGRVLDSPQGVRPGLHLVAEGKRVWYDQQLL
jgi:hypothetical protein